MCNACLISLFFWLIAIGTIIFSYSRLKKYWLEREHAVDALSVANQIITRSPAVAFLLQNDKKKPVEFVTSNVEKLLGYKAEQFIDGALTFMECVHPGDRQQLREELSKHTNDIAINSFEHKPYRIITKTGAIKWLEDTTYIRRDSKGRAIHFEKMLIDITIRQRATEKATLLAKIIEESFNEIYIFEGENLRFILVNQGALHNIGYSIEELKKRTPFDIAPEYTAESFNTLIEPLRTKEKDRIVFTTTHRRKDGSRYPVEVHIQMSQDAALFLAITLDTSERKKLEEQLLINEKMTTIAGLAAGVAHEINTPLSGILQSIQLLEMGFDPSVTSNQQSAAKHQLNLHALRRYLQEKELDFFLSGIRQSATTASQIVSDLLQFCRPGDKQYEKTNIPELIERSIELAKTDYHLKKRNRIQDVQFIQEHVEPLLTIDCVAMEIEQVLINLIKNSCQAMSLSAQKRPTITIRTRQRTKTALIEVGDNGPGIPQEIRAKIFDPFFTTRDIDQGTGLGLAVSYTIICDNHKGTIEVKSTPGKETTFVIELPLTRESQLIMA